MERVLVAVLVALALLQPVRPQVGAQETEESFSTNRGREQPTDLILDHYLLQLNNKLDTLNSKLEVLDATFSQHKQQTGAELAQLQTSLTNTQSSLEQLYVSLSLHKQGTAAELAQLHNKTTATATQLLTSIQEIQANISDGKCVDMAKCLQLLRNSDNVTHQLESVVHDVHGPYTCGGTGGWRRVVSLNMTDLSTTCPSGWQPTGYSRRTCGRATFGQHTCDSVTFPVSGGEYSKVCGRIKAYQWGYTAAFRSYYLAAGTTIDGAYVDGITVTHNNNSRQHIWTFVAGSAEGNPGWSDICPCDSRHARRVPPFVGNDYFCESGVNERWNSSKHYSLHFNDTLWDGENCLSSSTCCSLHNPPYFVKQLPTPTTDDIDARMCLFYASSADIAVELIELYVQ